MTTGSPWRAEAGALLKRLTARWNQLQPPDDLSQQFLADAEAALAETDNSVRGWWNGRHKETVWRSLHAAEARITSLGTDLGGRLPDVKARTGQHLSSRDERYKALIGIDPANLGLNDRTAVETALEAALRLGDDGFSTLRGHRNRLLYTATALLVVLLVIGTAATFKPTMLPLGIGQSTGGGDFWWVALWGLFGAIFAASVSGAKLKLSLAPYAFGVPLFGLKVVLGAAFAVVGVLALKAGVVAGQKVENQAALIVAAITLGYSQQLGTKILDTYSKKLVAEAKPSTGDVKSG
ncbi:hypothetical protein [Lentzea cavernae]|uniref:Uncharacterized protein n=1 Tax=Lentzea cavernae TaxID=2020703 RepID=A0ABQ3M3J5_9PSEU|nr:hypothetical protein [Lentzea cavernae]GHH31784.1 hypothetical protein GCM10017774_12150 [Lentzea cavernae]